MSVKDAEVEDLRIAALALRTFAFILCTAWQLPTDTDGLPLGEGWDLNCAGLIRVFVVRSTSSTYTGAEMVLCAL